MSAFLWAYLVSSIHIQKSFFMHAKPEEARKKKCLHCLFAEVVMRGRIMKLTKLAQVAAQLRKTQVSFTQAQASRPQADVCFLLHCDTAQSKYILENLENVSGSSFKVFWVVEFEVQTLCYIASVGDFCLVAGIKWLFHLSPFRLQRQPTPLTGLHI